ncbi:MAG: polysaccharide deacetylase family protein [Opitutaceae bacterium]|nr:polysaccharide deacetylase family protein [Opitutaceae bacterium]
MARWIIFSYGAGKGAAAWCWLAAGLPGLAWFFFLGADMLVLYQVLVPGAQGLLRVVTSFETREREVWLTIDDGPDPHDTPRILAVLAEHQARATFFLVGEKAAQHPDLVRSILDAGHDVGHHTHTHPSGTLWFAGPRRLARELDKALEAYAAATINRGGPVLWFRAPVGIKNLLLGRELRKRGLTCVHWSLRSWDSTARSAASVARRVMSRVKPGAIILVHEGERLHPDVRVKAVTEILGQLKLQQYRCVLPSAQQLRPRIAS